MVPKKTSHLKRAQANMKLKLVIVTKSSNVQNKLHSLIDISTDGISQIYFGSAYII